MSLKIFSINKALTHIIIFMAMGAMVSCTPRVISPSPSPERIPVYKPSPAPPVSAPEPEVSFPKEPEIQQPPVVASPKPRLMASLQLTQQAQALIKDRQPDNAIRILEQAVAIDPSNGQNYYYLAEAWLMKENIEQALNFNELAAIHLGSDTAWEKKIADQKARIEKLNTAVN